MKNLIPSTFIILFYINGVPVHGADFQKGWSAAKVGDYATALHEWRPLAEEGHVEAQFYLELMYASGQGVAQDSREEKILELSRQVFVKVSTTMIVAYIV